MSTKENFKRQYILSVKSNDDKYQIGEVNEKYPVPLHVSFSIQKSDLETQNTGKIDIWNLSKRHIAVLEKKHCVVALRAGYGNRTSLIFAGQLTFVSTVPDGADMKTTIEVLDGLNETKDLYVNLSYNGNINWKTIFDDAATQLGVAVVYAPDITFVEMNNGYSYVGQAKFLFDIGCKACNLSWSIQNGVLHVKKKGGAISKKVFLLNADTGLLGSPEKVTVTDEDDSEKKITGYDVTYFLNGAINIDDYVELESKTVSGYFYVKSLDIKGDNTSGDWTCKARLLSLQEQKGPEITTESDIVLIRGNALSQIGIRQSGFDSNISKGDKVKIAIVVNQNPPTDYYGKALPGTAFSLTYTVLHIENDRVSIGVNNVVQFTMNLYDLSKVKEEE